MESKKTFFGPRGASTKRESSAPDSLSAVTLKNSKGEEFVRMNMEAKIEIYERDVRMYSRWLAEAAEFSAEAMVAKERDFASSLEALKSEISRMKRRRGLLISHLASVRHENKLAFNFATFDSIEALKSKIIKAEQRELDLRGRLARVSQAVDDLLVRLEGRGKKFRLNAVAAKARQPDREDFAAKFEAVRLRFAGAVRQWVKDAPEFERRKVAAESVLEKIEKKVSAARMKLAGIGGGQAGEAQERPGGLVGIRRSKATERFTRVRRSEGIDRSREIRNSEGVGSSLGIRNSEIVRSSLGVVRRSERLGGIEKSGLQGPRGSSVSPSAIVPQELFFTQTVSSFKELTFSSLEESPITHLKIFQRNGCVCGIAFYFPRGPRSLKKIFGQTSPSCQVFAAQGNTLILPYKEIPGRPGRFFVSPEAKRPRGLGQKIRNFSLEVDRVSKVVVCFTEQNDLVKIVFWV